MKAIEQAVKAMEAASSILGVYTPDRWNQELTAKWRERAAELDAAIAALESDRDEEVVAEWRADIDPVEVRRLVEGMQEQPWVACALSFVPDKWATIPRFGPAMSKELAENSRFKQRVRVRILAVKEGER